jgi:hypothetical protein
MLNKNHDATKQWAQLCEELEEAKTAYEAAEARLACPGGPEADTTQALRASLQAATRMIETLEKMRKLTTRQE